MHVQQNAIQDHIVVEEQVSAVRAPEQVGVAIILSAVQVSQVECEFDASRRVTSFWFPPSKVMRQELAAAFEAMALIVRNIDQ